MNYLLDTNVLLLDADNALEYFLKKGKIVICEQVLKELEKHKVGLNDLATQSRKAIRRINELYNNEDITFLFDPVKFDLADDTIINTCKEFGKNNEITIVSNDLVMRLKLTANNINAISYDVDNAYEELTLNTYYSGHTEIMVNQEMIDEFYKRKEIEIDFEFYPNQCVTMVSCDKKYPSIFKNGKLFPINVPKKVYGLVPRNLEQQYALHLLNDDSIKFVSLTGASGTFKTLAAVSSGLHCVTNTKKYDKFLVAKPPIPLSKELNIGTLPGHIEEKLQHYLGSITTNLEVLREKDKFGKPLSGFKILESLITQEMVELLDIGSILGRNINDYCLIDEFQLLKTDEALSCLSRLADGKLVVTGDLMQLLGRKLSLHECGLFKTIEIMKNCEQSAHLTLKTIQRSEFVDYLVRNW